MNRHSLITATASARPATIATVVAALALAAGCGRPVTGTASSPAPTGTPTTPATPTASAVDRPTDEPRGTASPTSTASPTPAPRSATPTPTPTTTSKPPSNGEMTLTGTVEACVEMGCLLLRHDGKTYRLVGGDPAVVKPKWRVTVRGKPDRTAISYCMQGTAFRVTSAQPA